MTVLLRRFIGPLAALGFLAAFAGGVFAQSPSPAELMDEANLRYERGEYVEAAQQYEIPHWPEDTGTPPSITTWATPTWRAVTWGRPS